MGDLVAEAGASKAKHTSTCLRVLRLLRTELAVRRRGGQTQDRGERWGGGDQYQYLLILSDAASQCH